MILTRAEELRDSVPDPQLTLSPNSYPVVPPHEMNVQDLPKENKEKQKKAKKIVGRVGGRKNKGGKSRARCGGVTGYEIRHLPIRSCPPPLPYPVTHILVPLRIRSKDHNSSGCLKFPPVSNVLSVLPVATST